MGEKGALKEGLRVCGWSPVGGDTVDPLRLTVVSERRHLQASHEEDGGWATYLVCLVPLRGADACLAIWQSGSLTIWVLASPSAHLSGCPLARPRARAPADGTTPPCGRHPMGGSRASDPDELASLPK